MARTILHKGAGAGSSGTGGTTARRARASGAGDDAAVVRWQMNPIGQSEDGGTGPLRAGAGPGGADPVPPARPPEEELAAIRAAAHEQGHAEGLTAGRAAGARETAELALLISRLSEVMNGFEQELAVDMLGLALEIARQIMRHTIHVHPEVVLPVIREAIASMPQGSLHPRLLLHPEDAALVRSVLVANQITPAPWRIVEDARLERGGCRIETATSELDASVESRWKAVVAALGREEGWVDLDVPARAGTPATPREPR